MSGGSGRRDPASDALEDPSDGRRDAIGVILGDEVLATLDPVQGGAEVVRQPVAVADPLELIGRPERGISRERRKD